MFSTADLFQTKARKRIDNIMRAPDRWGNSPTIAAYVLSGGAFAVFFGGGMPEVFVATIIGLIAGVLAVVLRRWRVTTRLFELLAATAAAFITGIAGHYLGSFVEWIPLAAGLIILLPGISLLDSVTELSHGRLESGAARLAGVGVAFTALACGAIAGTSISDLLPRISHSSPSQPFGTWQIFLALTIVALGSTVRFRARLQDLPVIFLASLLAFYVTRWETELIAGLAGPFLAAFLLGVAGSLFAKFAARYPGTRRHSRYRAAGSRLRRCAKYVIPAFARHDCRSRPRIQDVLDRYGTDRGPLVQSIVGKRRCSRGNLQ